MIPKQVLASAQKDLVRIMEAMRAACHQWALGEIDADEYGEKIADAMYDLDDYRKEYAPTALQRFLQTQDHVEQLTLDVFRDAQEDDLT